MANFSLHSFDSPLSIYIRLPKPLIKTVIYASTIPIYQLKKQNKKKYA